MTARTKPKGMKTELKRVWLSLRAMKEDIDMLMDYVEGVDKGWKNGSGI